MPDVNPYFEIQPLGERVELRSSARLIRSTFHPAGLLLLCFGPVVFYYLFGGSTTTDWLIAIGTVIRSGSLQFTLNEVCFGRLPFR